MKLFKVSGILFLPQHLVHSRRTCRRCNRNRIPATSNDRPGARTIFRSGRRTCDEAYVIPLIAIRSSTTLQAAASPYREEKYQREIGFVREKIKRGKKPVSLLQSSYSIPLYIYIYIHIHIYKRRNESTTVSSADSSKTYSKPSVKPVDIVDSRDTKKEKT